MNRRVTSIGNPKRCKGSVDCKLQAPSPSEYSPNPSCNGIVHAKNGLCCGDDNFGKNKAITVTQNRNPSRNAVKLARLGALARRSTVKRGVRRQLIMHSLGSKEAQTKLLRHQPKKPCQNKQAARINVFCQELSNDLHRIVMTKISCRSQQKSLIKEDSMSA